jgi:hypothetical protein
MGTLPQWDLGSISGRLTAADYAAETGLTLEEQELRNHIVGPDGVAELPKNSYRYGDGDGDGDGNGDGYGSIPCLF